MNESKMISYFLLLKKKKRKWVMNVPHQYDHLNNSWWQEVIPTHPGIL